MTETLSERKAGAVAAALGKGLSPGRQHDCPRKKAAAAGLHLKAIVGRDDVVHTLTCDERCTGAPRCSKQSIQYVARAIAVGKQLAVGLFVYVDANLAEERDCFGDWKRPKDAPDDRRSPAPEIVFGDNGVGEVAARSAADEDLGARLPRAFEHDDGQGRIVSSREDRGCQAGGARADNRNLAGEGGIRQGPKLTAVRRPAPSSAPSVRRTPCTGPRSSRRCRPGPRSAYGGFRTLDRWAEASGVSGMAGRRGP